jgi:hypothetical protein
MPNVGKFNRRLMGEQSPIILCTVRSMIFRTGERSAGMLISTFCLMKISSSARQPRIV